ncbi:MAG: ribosome maturation factor RimM [Bryobacteraceae bacterium]
MSSGWIAVGRLLRVRGNRGELAGVVYSSRPGRIEALKEVTLEVNGRREAARIEKIWHHGGRPIFKFSGIDSISDAEPWAGADILVPESERIEPEQGEYSHADLIGCTVTGSGLTGVVKGVEDYGGAPLLRVEAEGGGEVLIPFARAICREIDIAAKTIRVDLPEGLTEI